MPPATDHALLELWRSARIWIEVPGQGGTELVPSAHADRAGFPLALDAIHLLSAWNPGGVELDRSSNEARHRELAAAVQARQLEHWQAAGYSADHSWVEHGLALPRAGRAEAIRLAAQFGQLAIYEWTATALAIVECASSSVTATYGWSAHPLVAPPRN